jgi:hypothetical protein
MIDTYKTDRRDTSLTSDRRRDPRVGAHLDAHLVMSESFLHQDMATDEVRNIKLYGYVHDMSASGVGIVVPSTCFDTRTCSEGLPIHLTFASTKASVDVQAEAIHCAPLNLQEPMEGYVVGAKFNELSEQARAAITAHLRQPPEI